MKIPAAATASEATNKKYDKSTKQSQSVRRKNIPSFIKDCTYVRALHGHIVLLIIIFRPNFSLKFAV